MKKSLFALAALGAFAGVAQAQSSVTLYGAMDTSVQAIQNGGINPAATTAQKSIASATATPQLQMPLHLLLMALLQLQFGV